SARIARSNFPVPATAKNNAAPPANGSAYVRTRPGMRRTSSGTSFFLPPAHLTIGFVIAASSSATSSFASAGNLLHLKDRRALAFRDEERRVHTFEAREHPLFGVLGYRPAERDSPRLASLDAELRLVARDESFTREGWSEVKDAIGHEPFERGEDVGGDG